MFKYCYRIGDRFGIQFPNGTVYEGWVHGYGNQGKVLSYCRKHNWNGLRNVLKIEGWNV